MRRLEAAHLSKRADALRDLERKAKATELRESLQDTKRGLGRAYAKLRSGTAKPIGFLRGPTGRVTAHLVEVDAIVQEAWSPVYQGQAGQHGDIVAHFLAKYRDFIYHGEAFQVKAITGERLLHEFRNSAATAASWGQWEHGAWAVMPVEAADWLAKLLTLVEEGAPWPRPTTWGKAFFLLQNGRAFHRPHGVQNPVDPVQALPTLGQHAATRRTRLGSGLAVAGDVCRSPGRGR
jgi:hypothetical protein